MRAIFRFYRPALCILFVLLLLGYETQAQDVTFVTSRDMFLDHAVDDLLTDDFNSDGLTDLLLYSHSYGGIQIAFNDRYRPFEYVYQFPLSHIQDIFCSDIDGDSDVDLVVSTSTDTGELITLFNNGRGEFSLPESVIKDVSLYYMTSIDLEPDGDIDILALSTTAGVVALYNNGSGQFDVGPCNIPSRFSRPPYTVDVNGDGLTDVLFGGADFDSMAVLLGEGNGEFTEVSKLPVRGDLSVAIEDYNADGLPDLAVTKNESDSVWLLENQGRGIFALEVAGKAMENTVDQNLRLVPAFGDFDTDGKPDLAIISGTKSCMSVLRIDGATPLTSMGTFATGCYPTGVRACHLDGDGHIDIAVASSAGGIVSLLYSTGEFRFAAAPAVPVGWVPESLCRANFDQDGRPDLVVGCRNDNGIYVVRFGDDGKLHVTQRIEIDEEPSTCIAIDMNRDGYDDIVTACRHGHRLYIHMNSGDGTFATGPGESFTCEIRYLNDITASDFDGDGWPDLAVTAENGVRILRNDGSGALLCDTTAVIGPVAGGIYASDQDSDGDPDLVLIANFAKGLLVAYNSGLGQFECIDTVQCLDSTIWGTWYDMADYDGDGHLDVLAWSPGIWITLWGEGGSAFTVDDGPDIAFPFDILPIDFDGDGDLDLASFSFVEDRYLTIVRNDGGRQFQVAQDIPIGIVRAVAVAFDYDRDGDQDIAATGYSTNNVTVFVNTSDSHTDVPSDPDQSDLLPVHFLLDQNYPNPFNPSTRISFDLPVQGPVVLTVYNTLGQSVRTLVDNTLAVGQYSVEWDGTSDDGEAVATGVYFYKLEVGDMEQSRKMILLR